MEWEMERKEEKCDEQGNFVLIMECTLT